MTSETANAVPVQPIKVGSQSDPNGIAEVIAGRVRELGRAEAQTIGAGALNQAIKAVAIARGLLAPSGADLICYPSFASIGIGNSERTAIRLFIEPRDLPQPATTEFKPLASHRRRTPFSSVFPPPVPIQAVRTHS